MALQMKERFSLSKNLFQVYSNKVTLFPIMCEREKLFNRIEKNTQRKVVQIRKKKAVKIDLKPLYFCKSVNEI